MAKPVRVYVDREDYYWLVRRFGNDGVRPARGELISRIRRYVENFEYEHIEEKK